MKLILVLLSIFGVINSVYSSITVRPIVDDPTLNSITYNASKYLEFSCDVASDNPDELKSVKVQWQKDGLLVTKNETLNKRFQTKTPDANDKATRYTILTVSSEDEDAGNWTCIVNYGNNQTVESTIQAFSRPLVRVPISANFVEDEPLRIECTVYGKPSATIHWTYKNESLNLTQLSRDERVSFEKSEKGIENAVLIIKDIHLYDRGEYTCVGNISTGAETSSMCMVRVKDKYAAVWPFLGICAEVFVLCAIIFIYEKKRNKTELEESDTDQSPEQKNTPDHNKDSNLRHRQ